MPKTSRRNIFKGLFAGASAAALLGQNAIANAEILAPKRKTKAINTPPKRGIEGQRKADLGNGYFQNPIISGDRPDPTILKDGEDYYMTFTSFNLYPGLTIWHSKDLVNWSPIGAALTKPIGNVFAVDLCKHNGRYYIYIPAMLPGKDWVIYVIWADNIKGPWSDPIDTGVRACIDPCHMVGEDNKRYLFVNGVRKIALSDDGLRGIGNLENAYEPWRYPKEWVVENFAPEGPKLFKKDDWFYLVTAVGGTAGPPTGHMVIVARSKSIHGPWEHCPNNPIVRTKSADEPWWSRGHATIFQGQANDWWMVYHGYENGYRTLGRQTLLAPVEWSKDGWPIALGGDLSMPMPIPHWGKSGPNGAPISDDFSTNRFGTLWGFHEPKDNENARLNYSQNGLFLAASGNSPADSSPMVCPVGDRVYSAEISLEIDDNAEAGLLLFYNHKAFVGVGFDKEKLKTFASAQEQGWMAKTLNTKKLRLKLLNDENIVTFKYSLDDGISWQLNDLRFEVSGINHNVFGDFLSLKIGIYAAKSGKVKITNFKYLANEFADRR